MGEREPTFGWERPKRRPINIEGRPHKFTPNLDPWIQDHTNIHPEHYTEDHTNIH